MKQGQHDKRLNAIFFFIFLFYGLHYCLRALSICQNWPAGPLPEQSVWKWNRLFLRVFLENPSFSCILFRIWPIWLDSFDWKWNSRYDWKGLACQFWQMEIALNKLTDQFRFLENCPATPPAPPPPPPPPKQALTLTAHLWRKMMA